MQYSRVLDATLYSFCVCLCVYVRVFVEMYLHKCSNVLLLFLQLILYLVIVLIAVCCCWWCKSLCILLSYCLPIMTVCVLSICSVCLPAYVQMQCVQLSCPFLSSYPGFLVIVIDIIGLITIPTTLGILHFFIYMPIWLFCAHAVCMCFISTFSVNYY